MKTITVCLSLTMFSSHAVAQDAAQVLRESLRCGIKLAPTDAMDTPRDDGEAERLAVEMIWETDHLIVPDDVYRRVRRDLAAIRKSSAEVSDVTHYSFVQYTTMKVRVPGETPESLSEKLSCLENLFGVRVSTRNIY